MWIFNVILIKETFLSHLHICNMLEIKIEKNVYIQIFSLLSLGFHAAAVTERYRKNMLAFSWENYHAHMHLDMVTGEMRLSAKTYNPAKIHSATLCHSRNNMLFSPEGGKKTGCIWPPDLSSLPSPRHSDFLLLHIALVHVSLGLCACACRF